MTNNLTTKVDTCHLKVTACLSTQLSSRIQQVKYFNAASPEAFFATDLECLRIAEKLHGEAGQAAHARKRLVVVGAWRQIATLALHLSMPPLEIMCASCLVQRCLLYFARKGHRAARCSLSATHIFMEPCMAKRSPHRCEQRRSRSSQ